MIQLIKFKDNEYLLVEGAIATKEQYENGLVSYAHLFKDGKIRRFNKIIGTEKDIKYIKMIEVNVSSNAINNMMDALFFRYS